VSNSYFCRVEGLESRRDDFFSSYDIVLERKDEFNAGIIYTHTGERIGVSYLSVHPQTEEPIYRHDIFWNPTVSKRMQAYGLEFNWDQVMSLRPAVRVNVDFDISI